ncbi:MAG: hypothetical protein ACRECO_15330 [Xanthobacteraceae bacterium]
MAILIGIILASAVVPSGQALAQNGVELGNNIAVITHLAKSGQFKTERLGAEDTVTSIWEGSYGAPLQIGTPDPRPFSRMVADMEDAIRRCDEARLIALKIEALLYLQQVTATSTHPAISIAQLIRTIRIRCGQHTYAAETHGRDDVRRTFRYFEPIIRREQRLLEQAKQKGQRQAKQKHQGQAAPTPAATGVSVTQTAAAPGIEVSATGGAGNVNAPPTGFLGVREQGTVNERLGVLKPNANTFVSSVDGSLRLDFTNVRLFGLPGGLRMDLNFNHTSGDRRQGFGTFDPLGQVLLLPGASDPGFSLTSGVPVGTPGGFNVVEDIFYQRTYRSNAFGFTLEQPIVQTGRVSVSALTGLNYSRTSIDERFNFAVPRFLSDGAYNSNLDLSTFTPTFGGGVYVAVGDIAPGQTVIYGKAAMGPAFTRAGGTDRFNMIGFINTNQAADLSGNHTGFFGSFTGGVRVAVGDLVGDGSVTYVTSDSFGNVVRTGQTGETSRVNFVRGDATIFKFALSAKFSGGIFVAGSDLNR